MKSILGIGNALTDVFLSLPDSSLLEKFGLRPGSANHVEEAVGRKILEEMISRGAQFHPGGSAANTVMLAAKGGLRCGFIGKTGDDDLGERYSRRLLGCGVSPVLLKGAHSSGCSMIFTTPPEGERTFVICRGAALELCPEELAPEMFAGYDYLHIEGYLFQCSGVVERAVEIARQSGMIISFDLGSCSIVKNFREKVSRIVADSADIVFANEQETEAFCGESAEAALRQIHSLMQSANPVAVVKLGAEGSLVMGGGEVLRIPVVPAKAVDTTGAGDAYAAGFLYAHSCGAGLQECGNVGSALASKVVETTGIRPDGLNAIQVSL